MENEPPRRRVRRAKRSRPVAPGHAEPVVAAERQPAPSPEAMDLASLAEEETVAPEIGGNAQPALSVDHEEWDAAGLPDSSRDGAWLPAGITVLVMVSLLVCAGLVLIASRQ